MKWFIFFIAGCVLLGISIWQFNIKSDQLSDCRDTEFDIFRNGIYIGNNTIRYQENANYHFCKLGNSSSSALEMNQLVDVYENNEKQCSLSKTICSDMLFAIWLLVAIFSAVILLCSFITCMENHRPGPLYATWR